MVEPTVGACPSRHCPRSIGTRVFLTGNDPVTTSPRREGHRWAGAHDNDVAADDTEGHRRSMAHDNDPAANHAEGVR